MKKKLEADLISIAHRVLKLKNKSDINQLYLETQKLYEKLTILKFVEENLEAATAKHSIEQIEEQVEAAFVVQETVTEAKPVVIETVVEPTIETPVATTEVIETPNVEIESAPVEEIPAEEVVIPKPLASILESVMENIPVPTEEPLVSETIETSEETVIETPIAVESVIVEPIVAETPTEIENEINEPIFTDTNLGFNKPVALFDQVEPEVTAVDETPFESFFGTKKEPEVVPTIETKTEEKPNVVQISFEDLMGINYKEAQFVKVDEVKNTPTPAATINDFVAPKVEPAETITETKEQRTLSLNEKLSKGIHIDLNDRLAFTKHLFGNSSEDYNRVLNQLITFDTFGETKQFIEDMVKPDYNNWEGKDDYAHRLMEILEKKFL